MLRDNRNRSGVEVSEFRPLQGCHTWVGGGALLAVVFCSSALLAADAAFVGVLALAVEDEVAKELKLSEEVLTKLNQVIDAREQKALEFALSLRGLSKAEQAEKLGPFVAESEKQGLVLLTAEQVTRLRQLEIGRRGMVSLADPETAAVLQLTDEQKAAVDKMLVERKGDMTRGGERDRLVTKMVYERRLAGLLTDAQRAKWEGLTGSAAPEAIAANEVTPANPPATGTSNDPPAPNSTTGEQPSTMPQTGTDQGSQNGTNSLLSAAGDKDISLRFNFRFQPWEDVLDWFAKQADLSLVLDAPPPGTFNYTDSRRYTPAEAIDLLNSVLLTKGYTLLRRGRMLMLINLEDGIPPNLVSAVSVDDLDKRGEYELISCLFTLKKMSPADADKEIRPLLGPQGNLVVLPTAKQIFVTETAGRIRTIRSVIEAVENPGEDNAAFTTLTLKHITPDDLMLVARPLLGIPENLNATPEGTIRLAFDPLTPRIYFRGTDEGLAQLESVIKLVDVATDFGDGPEVFETPQLEVYPVTVADSNSALAVLQTLMDGLPDVRLAVDEKSGNIVALARPSQHATIRATLDQLQKDASQIEVIQLRVVDPQVAVLAIGRLFGIEEDDPTGND